MKSIRILAVVLCCALIFSFNVSAVTTVRILGNHYNSTDWQLIDMSGNNRTYSNKFVLELSDNFLPNTIYSWVIELNGQASYFRAYSNIVDIFINDTQLSYLYPSTGQNIIDATINSYYGNNFSNTILLLTVNTTGLELNGDLKYLYVRLETDPNSNGNAKVNVNNIVNYNSDTDSLIISNNINEKLDNVSSSINNSINQAADRIESSVNNIDTDSIIQILENIYNYGNTYNQIDQNIINGLGSAEDQLSNAEDAIQNKSESLVNKVASQWTANKSVASSFLTTITPATSAIGTVTDNFFTAIPEEIKNAVITIMLIVFIGWLIGRVEG